MNCLLHGEKEPEELRRRLCFAIRAANPLRKYQYLQRHLSPKLTVGTNGYDFDLARVRRDSESGINAVEGHRLNGIVEVERSKCP